MGSKGGSSPQTTTTSSSPPPQVMAGYQALTDRATNVANQPYQAYQGEQVAPLSYQTQAGLSGINQYANAAQPGYAAALAGTAAAATPVSPNQYSGQALAQFMNPYTQSVVNATQNQFNNQNMQQAQALNSNAIGAGAYGGDRAGVAQSVLANQQLTAQSPVIAGLNQANFTNAQNEFNTQQQTGLQAQEYNAGQLGAMANQYGTLTGQAQQAGLQGAQAQIQAGMIPQQEQQAIDTAQQNNYLQSQAYPFQTTGWLGNIIEGVGSASGGTGTTSSPGPSTASQAVGGITSGLGILGSLMSLSDARVKDDIRPIGKTFDGQTIYRFRFKGDPRTQIGLIAQEAEKRHPHAVGEGLGGLKHIDYGDATEHAADRGHFAFGGMIRPGYDVGGEVPQFLGQNGSIGVYTPGFNPQTQQLGPLAGVNEALAGAESAGQKNPYTGIDFDQAEAISAGQWMPPRTNSPLPDYSHPGSSPQTSGAEASLAGLIARPGMETDMTPGATPAASPLAAAASQPTGGTRGNYSPNGGGQWFSQSSPTAQATGLYAPNFGRGSVLNDAIANTPGLPAGAASGTGNPLWASMMRARGGRAGFARGGGPDFTTVQLNPTDRNKPIYTALDLSGKKSDPVPTPAPAPEHPAVTIARHIVRAADAHRQQQRQQQVVKRDGTTGQPILYEPGGGIMPPDPWPTPGPRGSGGFDPSTPGAATTDPTGPTVRFGAKVPFPARAPSTALTPSDPMGWSVGENPPPPPRGGVPAPFQPRSWSSAIPGLIGSGLRRIPGLGAALQTITPSDELAPPSMDELPPRFWPRQPGSNVIPLPSQSTGRPPIALHGPSGPIDLGTWEGEGGAAEPSSPEPTPRDPTAEIGWGDEGPVNYARGGRLMRAAGGMLGQSGISSALEQPPQGANVSGPGQGSFATANQAAGFSGLYGAGRSGFAAGGDPSALSPYANSGVVSWVPTPSGQMMGRGPPQAPNPPPQPSSSAGGQGQDLAKAIDKIGPMLKSKLGGQGDSPDPIALPSSGADASDGWGGAAEKPDFSNLADNTFDLSGAGFARGGRLARAAGGESTADPTDDQLDAMMAQPSPAPATAAPTTALGAIAEKAPPAAGNVGKGGYDPNAAIQQAFGDRAGYASTISNRESSLGKNWIGDDGSSFGDFQLHYGGISKQFPHPGLGDAFTAATGMDARNNDPATRQAVAHFVSDYTAKHGWGDWSTAHDAPSSAGGAGGAPSGADPTSGLSPMSASPHYFQPRDYADPNSSKRELFGAMMAAGFGMMAGTSPYAAVNIGQGGQAGVAYLQKQQELDRDWMLNQSKIDQMSSQERRADADVGLRVNQWNLELAKYRGMMATNANVANILSGGSGSGGSGGGSSAAPTGAPPPADTAGSTGPQGVAPSNLGDVGLGNQILSLPKTPGRAPEGNVAPLGSMTADHTQGAPPAFGGSGGATPKIAPEGAPAPIVAQGPSGKPTQAAPAGSAPSNVPSAEAQPVASPAPPASAAPAAATTPTGVPPENDPFWQGKPNPYRLLKAGQVLMASPDPGQQTRGQELMKQGQEIFKSIGETGMAGGAFVPGVLERKNMIEAQKPIYQKFQEDKQKFVQNYDITRGQLGELSHIYANFQAGRASEAEADLASWANAAGFKLPQAAGFDSAMKSAMLQAFDQVNASGLQKAPRASLREAILTVASPTKDPAALRKIMADSMATLDYNHDLYSSVNDYDTTKSVTQFTGSHKYEDYVKKARGEIPMFKGITPETLKNTTGEDWPVPAAPQGVPSGSQYSPARQQWRDPSGKLYDESGKPVP